MVLVYDPSAPWGEEKAIAGAACHLWGQPQLSAVRSRGHAER